MLNFTIKPGEYFTIGEDIKVVFLGGTANNYKVMVDAPRSYNIVRGSVLEKNAALQEEKEKLKKFYPEPGIPADCREKGKYGGLFPGRQGLQGFYPSEGGCCFAKWWNLYSRGGENRGT